jgi:hypothetical protein
LLAQELGGVAAVQWSQLKEGKVFSVDNGHHIAMLGKFRAVSHVGYV